MWEICKSGSVRGVEIPVHDLNNVALHIPKGWSNGEYKSNLKYRNHIMPTRQQYYLLIERLRDLKSKNH